MFNLYSTNSTKTCAHVLEENSSPLKCQIYRLLLIQPIQPGFALLPLRWLDIVILTDGIKYTSIQPIQP